jgi:hypothetical protein
MAISILISILAEYLWKMMIEKDNYPVTPHLHAISRKNMDIL